jgi:hypothetical protein
MPADSSHMHRPPSFKSRRDLSRGANARWSSIPSLSRASTGTLAGGREQQFRNTCRYPWRDTSTGRRRRETPSRPTAGDHFPAAGARSLGHRLHARTSGSAHWVPGDAWRGREPTTPSWGPVTGRRARGPTASAQLSAPCWWVASASEPTSSPASWSGVRELRPPQRGGTYAAGAPREVSAPLERQCLLWCSR